MRVLFVNPNRTMPRCAVFQAGRIYADALSLCSSFEVEYREVGVGDVLPDPKAYDAVWVNYQHVTASCLPMAWMSACPVLVGFTYEARLRPELSPMHGDGVMGDVFDLIVSPDPTLKSTGRVWGVPRVVPRTALPPQRENAVFTVSTFGFPSPWKDLASVVRRLNDEAERAVFRVNFSPGSWQEDTDLMAIAEAQAAEARALAKPGIAVRLSEVYMRDEELACWLAESDVNVFLARPERGEETGGALLASADWAIAARKPLLVSDTLEARHLRMFQRDPRCPVDLYDMWSPENFAGCVDKLMGEA